MYLKILDIDLKTINNEKINHEIIECIEPSPVSSISSLGYELIQHTTMQLYPEAIPIPGFKEKKFELSLSYHINMVIFFCFKLGMEIGSTDSRYYYRNTENVYKFTPVKTNMADAKRFNFYF